MRSKKRSLNEVKANTKKKIPLHRDLLTKNKNILEPFMDVKTHRKLEYWSATYDEDEHNHHHHQELFVQPDLVGCHALSWW